MIKRPQMVECTGKKNGYRSKREEEAVLTLRNECWID